MFVILSGLQFNVQDLIVIIKPYPNKYTFSFWANQIKTKQSVLGERVKYFSEWIQQNRVTKINLISHYTVYVYWTSMCFSHWPCFR